METIPASEFISISPNNLPGLYAADDEIESSACWTEARHMARHNGQGLTIHATSALWRGAKLLVEG